MELNSQGPSGPAGREAGEQKDPESPARGFLQPDGFTVCLALRPHYDPQPGTEAVLRGRVAALADRGLVRGFFLSEPPAAGGGPPALALARWVLERGGEPIVSVSAAGAREGEILDRVRALEAAGVRGLLAVTGDYPFPRRTAEPCFDLDSLQLLMLLRRGGAAPPRGCVVSPFKSLEAELLWQYAKLGRKLQAGADFVVSQAGYDARAWDELLRFCRTLRSRPALIGSVLVPEEGLARRIREGQLPGVAISPRLLERLVSPGGDGLRLAGAAVAVLRGLGYRGVLLGGRPFTPAEIDVILGESERRAPQWREAAALFEPTPPRFSYFRRDPATGLSGAERAEVRPRARYHPLYVFSYLVDYVAFGSWPPFFRLLTRLCRFCDGRPLGRRILWCVEFLSKAPLYRCRMCGDCTLYACGFLCCESGCPKRAANGPCGGSRDGKCEVTGSGTCFWVRVYDRLKATAERPGFPAAPIPPKDRRLEGGCSWINYCLGRDHRGVGRTAAVTDPVR